MYRVGIIGCGRRWKTEGATGFGQGHAHAAGYKASPDCEIVAAADINPENLAAFCQEHQVPGRYTDYREMLARENLDIVSVCVWPALHLPIVADAARSGIKAIHCEKPMAPTWGESQQMLAICEEHHVQFTINHQRRFGAPFRKAKALLDAGAIGALERIEAFAGNLYDWGTHWFDMMFFYNDETPAEWVIGQIDPRGATPVFGVMVEGQGLSFIRWRNGVSGLIATGYGLFRREEGRVMAETKSALFGIRLIGNTGVIEVGMLDGSPVRLRNVETAGQWQDIPVETGIHGAEHGVAAILDLVEALKQGREPELAGRKALQATELIFATYESSRRRGRVDLPLDVPDSAFLSMLEKGDLTID